MENMENSKMKIMKDTADRIKYFRLQKGLSQKSLAISAGLDPAFLGHIERCLKCPTIDTLNKITLALHISLSELFDYDKENITVEKNRIVDNIYFQVRRLNDKDAQKVAELVNKIVEFKLDL